ncbi:MAG TPA: sterol desaturase family protein [Myxococcales bacterium]|nr:sterol desaturase family protein [Myxococcales bacterium]
MELAAFRAEARAEQLGPRYSGLLHLAFVNVVSLAIIAVAGAQIHRPRLALLTVPIAFLYANLVEWLAHRGPMHAPRRFLGLVYRRHTLLHHAFFTAEQMSLESARDFKLVLFPPVLLLFFFGGLALPAGLLLGAFLGSNVAALFVITAMAYYLLYEWLHLAYHLGDRAPRLIEPLRRHHAAHHDPRNMTRGNFNITFPICDRLFGTCLR